MSTFKEEIPGIIIYQKKEYRADWKTSPPDCAVWLHQIRKSLRISLSSGESVTIAFEFGFKSAI